MWNKQSVENCPLYSNDGQLGDGDEHLVVRAGPAAPGAGASTGWVQHRQESGQLGGQPHAIRSESVNYLLPVCSIVTIVDLELF